MTELDDLRTQAAGCTRCDLHVAATATVFGEGAPHARVVVVGEQPGDQEDLQGRPFVGPAGQLFDRALAASALDRDALYVTNAVKHFKWIPRGKRRLHQSPNQTEVVACRPWLEGELDVIRPELVVALGATAGKALLGPKYRVTTQRGLLLEATVGSWSGQVLGTIHPSAILRFQDPDERASQFDALVADLASVASALTAGPVRARERRKRVAGNRRPAGSGGAADRVGGAAPSPGTASPLATASTPRVSRQVPNELCHPRPQSCSTSCAPWETSDRSVKGRTRRVGTLHRPLSGGVVRECSKLGLTEGLRF